MADAAPWAFKIKIIIQMIMDPKLQGPRKIKGEFQSCSSGLELSDLQRLPPNQGALCGSKLI